MGRSVEKSAKSVQEAIVQALEDLRLPIEDVDVEVLDEGKSAIFGLLGGKLARIRVTEISEEEKGITAAQLRGEPLARPPSRHSAPTGQAGGAGAPYSPPPQMARGQHEMSDASGAKMDAAAKSEDEGWRRGGKWQGDGYRYNTPSAPSATSAGPAPYAPSAGPAGQSMPPTGPGQARPPRSAFERAAPAAPTPPAAPAGHAYERAAPSAQKPVFARSAPQSSDRQGVGHAREGSAREGYSREGYAREGSAREGYAREGYAREGYARDGYARGGRRSEGGRPPQRGYGYNAGQERQDGRRGAGAYQGGRRDGAPYSSDSRASHPRRSETQSGALPLTQSDQERFAEKAEVFLGDLFEKLGIEVSMDVSTSEEAIAFALTSEDSGVLIGHRGETLDAIQYLANLYVNKDRSIDPPESARARAISLAGSGGGSSGSGGDGSSSSSSGSGGGAFSGTVDGGFGSESDAVAEGAEGSDGGKGPSARTGFSSGYVRVTVDVENYKKKREDSLVRLAERMADKAVRLRRSFAFDAMNSYERRIIHEALQRNHRVETYSVGEDPNRKVIVALKSRSGGRGYGHGGPSGRSGGNWGGGSGSRWR